MRVYLHDGPNDPGREVDPSTVDTGPMKACCTMGDLFSEHGYVWSAPECPHHRDDYDLMRAAVEDNDFSGLGGKAQRSQLAAAVAKDLPAELQVFLAEGDEQ